MSASRRLLPLEDANQITLSRSRIFISNGVIRVGTGVELHRWQVARELDGEKRSNWLQDLQQCGNSQSANIFSPASVGSWHVVGDGTAKTEGARFRRLNHYPQDCLSSSSRAEDNLRPAGTVGTPLNSLATRSQMRWTDDDCQSDRLRRAQRLQRPFVVTSTNDERSPSNIKT